MIELTLNCLSTIDSNKKLDQIWSILQKEFDDFKWQLSCVKFGNENRLYFGRLQIGGSYYEVSVTYEKKYLAKTLEFKPSINSSVSADQRLEGILNNLKNYSLSRFTLEIYVKNTIACLAFYKTSSFSIIPTTFKGVNKVILGIDAYSKKEAQGKFVTLFKMFIEVLSTLTHTYIYQFNPDDSCQCIDSGKVEYLDFERIKKMNLGVNGHLGLMKEAVDLLDRLLARKGSGFDSIIAEACKMYYLGTSVTFNLLDSSRMVERGRKNDIVEVEFINEHPETNALDLKVDHKYDAGNTILTSGIETLCSIHKLEISPCSHCGSERYKLSKKVREFASLVIG